MITPDKIQQLTELSAKTLSAVLENSGYLYCRFHTAKFVGINESGHFVYSTTYYENSYHELAQTRVYVKHDHNTGAVTAEF
jgi:hypothetical protein